MQTAHGIMRGIGQRLRDRRLAGGLTQDQLAKRAGVSRPTLIRMEAGGNIGLEPLVRVAMALDAGAEFLGLFPPVDRRSLDQILADQRKPQRARRSAASSKRDAS